jgi:hypothetical protein
MEQNERKTGAWNFCAERHVPSSAAALLRRSAPHLFALILPVALASFDRALKDV